MGLDMSLGSLPRLSHAKSPSLSAENPTGGKGQDAPATEGIRGDRACQDDNGSGRQRRITVGIGAKSSPWRLMRKFNWRREALNTLTLCVVGEVRINWHSV